MLERSERCREINRNEGGNRKYEGRRGGHKIGAAGGGGGRGGRGG